MVFQNVENLISFSWQIAMNFSHLNNATAMHSSRWVNMISGVWMCLIVVIGVFLNAFVLIVLFKDKYSITPYKIHIIGMVINNLCLCCLGLGMPIIAEFSGHFLLLMNMKLCIVEAFIVYMFGLATMFDLTAIAISRYIIVTKKTIYVSNRVSVIIVCVCECLAVMFALAPLLGWGSYGLEAHGTGCGLDWRDKSESAISYIITITVMCFGLPTAINIFCYQRIYAKVTSTCNRVQNASPGASPGASPVLRHMQRREDKLFKVSVAIIVAFLVTWTPYAIVSFYTAFGNPRNMDPLLSRSASLFAKSMVIWNTALYIIVPDDFRETAITVLKSFRSERRYSGTESPIPLEDIGDSALSRRQRLNNAPEIVEYVTVV